MIQTSLKCVGCIVERKVAEQTGTEPLPTVRPAVAILDGQTTCAEHIVFQRQSPLAAPNGSPILMPGA